MKDSAAEQNKLLCIPTDLSGIVLEVKKQKPWCVFWSDVRQFYGDGELNPQIAD